jgi:hypothetical protein
MVLILNSKHQVCSQNLKKKKKKKRYLKRKRKSQQTTTEYFLFQSTKFKTAGQNENEKLLKAPLT